MRPRISPVDITRTFSSCGSGQRSISVSSMCTGTEHDPGHPTRLDANTAREPSAVDHDREGVIAGLDVGHGELLAILRVGVIALAVGLGVRVRSLLRLGLHHAVHPRLGHGPPRAGPEHTTTPSPTACTGVPSALLNSTPWCCWKLPPIVAP